MLGKQVASSGTVALDTLPCPRTAACVCVVFWPYLLCLLVNVENQNTRAAGPADGVCGFTRIYGMQAADIFHPFRRSLSYLLGGLQQVSSVSNGAMQEAKNNYTMYNTTLLLWPSIDCNFVAHVTKMPPFSV